MESLELVKTSEFIGAMGFNSQDKNKKSAQNLTFEHFKISKLLDTKNGNEINIDHFFIDQ